MFFGLLRLGFHERGAFGLGRLMWKQVSYWYFLLIMVFSAHMGGPHSQGCHLALNCDYRRSPTCGERLNSYAPPFLLS